MSRYIITLPDEAPLRFEDGEWSGDPELVEYARILGECRPQDGYEPSAEDAIAEYVARVLGGTITTRLITPSTAPDNAIF